MWTELNDTEADYGAWEFTLEAVLDEEKQRHPVTHPPDIWPNWSEGVPMLLRRTSWCDRFWKNGVRHDPRLCTETVELDWCSPRNLGELAQKLRSLPSAAQSEWSGVYRIYVDGQSIDRMLGKDCTGTLYVGMAGDGAKRWSIMRNRIFGLATRRNHHIADKWLFNEQLEKRFPWKSLLIQWAFTQRRMNYMGNEISGARTAESYLLYSYQDSFGELPPLNEKT